MFFEYKTVSEIATTLQRTEKTIKRKIRELRIARPNHILDLEDEIWADIPGYEGYYQVSNKGRVKSLPRWIHYSDGRVYFYDSVVLKQKHDHGGYCMVELTINSNLATHKVHRLVANAFIPNPNNLPQVNHKDENKDNNAVENLEWCDQDYNNNYGTRLERLKNIITEKYGIPVVFTNINTGEKIYSPSIKNGAIQLGLDPRSVQRCLKNEPYFKTVKGYTVEYA